MIDGNVIPREKFESSTTDGKSFVFTPKATTFNGEIPVFQGVTFTSENIKEVKIQPVDKAGNPTGDAKTESVPSDGTPTKITFDQFKPSDAIEVKFVLRTPTQAFEAKVISFTACLSEDDVPLATTVKPGSCPADRVGKRVRDDVPCSSDSGCAGNTKCCPRAGQWVCRMPDTVVSGTCPTVKQKKSGTGKSTCDGDNDCGSISKKCCPNGKGGYDCTNI